MNEKLEFIIQSTLKNITTCNEDLKHIEFELRDHLYSSYEHYLKEGYSEEIATKQAITDFGKVNDISSNFNDIISPIHNKFQTILAILFIFYSIYCSWILLIERLLVRIRQYVTSEIPSGLFYVNSNSNLWDKQQFFDFSLWQTNINFVPFNGVIYYIQNFDYHRNISIDNLLGNFILLLPLGFFLPLLFNKFNNLSRVTTIIFLTSLLIELFQFGLQIGRADIDDVLLPTFGGICGYALAQLFIQVIRKINKRRYNNEII